MLFIGILALLGAVVLSIVSAIFSINGIQTIFSGAILWATVMAASMEFAKVASTVWVYTFWNKTKVIFKSYIVSAIIILILISSIGIYGFLAKAYVGQSVQATQLSSKIERLNISIEVEQRNIDRANKQLKILDDAIESYIDLDIITRGLQSLEEQKSDRADLLKQIRESDNRIGELQDEVFLLQNEIDTLEVNVGPIKYIAIALYGEENAESKYDDAARLFIILLVVVFDPFAVLLMVAGNMAVNKWLEGRKKKKKSTYKKQRVPKIESSSIVPDVEPDSESLESILTEIENEEMIINTPKETFPSTVSEEIEPVVPMEKPEDVEAIQKFIKPVHPVRVVKKGHKVLTRKEEMNEKKHLPDYDPLDKSNPLS